MGALHMGYICIYFAIFCRRGRYGRHQGCHRRFFPCKIYVSGRSDRQAAATTGVPYISSYMKNFPSESITTCGAAHLAKTFVEFSEDARFIEHLALVAVLVVVGDALAQVARQLAIDHVLLDLLELHIIVTATCKVLASSSSSSSSLFHSRLKTYLFNKSFPP